MDPNQVLGSTMIAVNQLILTKKSTSYTLSLVSNDIEVGTIVINIVKQMISQTNNGIDQLNNNKVNNRYSNKN